MSNHRLAKFIVALLLITIMFAISGSVDAQCAMCKAVLTSSNNSSFIRNFNIGVLVLLIPPVTIFCSIFVVLRKHRD